MKLVYILLFLLFTSGSGVCQSLSAIDGTAFYMNNSAKVFFRSNKQILIEGDSRVSGVRISPSLTFPSQLAVLIGNASSFRDDLKIFGKDTDTILVRNVGDGGATVGSVLSEEPAEVDPYFDPKGVNIYIGHFGGNDLINSQPGEIFAAIKSIYNDKVKDGWDSYFCTVGSGGGPYITPEVEKKRQALNKLIRTNIPKDKLIDLAADARFSNAENKTYYLDDKIHHTAAGNLAMAQDTYLVLFPNSQKKLTSK